MLVVFFTGTVIVFLLFLLLRCEGYKSLGSQAYYGALFQPFTICGKFISMGEGTLSSLSCSGETLTYRLQMRRRTIFHFFLVAFNTSALVPGYHPSLLSPAR